MKEKIIDTISFTFPSIQKDGKFYNLGLNRVIYNPTYKLTFLKRDIESIIVSGEWKSHLCYAEYWIIKKYYESLVKPTTEESKAVDLPPIMSHWHDEAIDVIAKAGSETNPNYGTKENIVNKLTHPIPAFLADGTIMVCLNTDEIEYILNRLQTATEETQIERMWEAFGNFCKAMNEIKKGE